MEALSGIGSNSDSFYEYLLKVYLVFGDVDHWDMFLETYARIGDHVRQGDWYADVDMFAGKPRRQHFENLQAFWPGLQVLAGDVALAARSLNAFWGAAAVGEGVACAALPPVNPAPPFVKSELPPVKPALPPVKPALPPVKPALPLAPNASPPPNASKVLAAAAGACCCGLGVLRLMPPRRSDMGSTTGAC